MKAVWLAKKEAAVLVAEKGVYSVGMMVVLLASLMVDLLVAWMVVLKAVC